MSDSKKMSFFRISNRVLLFITTPFHKINLKIYMKIEHMLFINFRAIKSVKLLRLFLEDTTMVILSVFLILGNIPSQASVGAKIFLRIFF